MTTLNLGLGALLLALLTSACASVAPESRAPSTAPAPPPVDEPELVAVEPVPDVSPLRLPPPAPSTPGLPAASVDDRPPSHPGRCPPPGPDTLRLFARAAGLAETTEALETHRAVTEALRMRLDELFQSGCQVALNDQGLVEEVKRLTENMANPPAIFGTRLGDDTVMLGHATSYGGGVAMYTWSRGKMRTRIDLTGEGMDLEDRLLLLNADLFQPPGAMEPLLVVANTHPWMASCWRTLRFRVLAPSGDPASPTVLLDRPGSGRWCEDVSIRASGADLTFQFDGWRGVLEAPEFVRPHVLAYHYENGVLTERFGFAPGFHLLVEDWLEQPWSLASQATLHGGDGRLEALHDQLSTLAKEAESASSQPDGPSLTQELFPAGSPTRRRLVVYCSLSEGKKPCPNWKKPVDFHLAEEGGRWYVSDVKPRP